MVAANLTLEAWYFRLASTAFANPAAAASSVAVFNSESGTVSVVCGCVRREVGVGFGRTERRAWAPTAGPNIAIVSKNNIDATWQCNKVLLKHNNNNPKQGG